MITHAAALLLKRTSHSASFSSVTALKDGQLVTSGGRVLGVTAVADDLKNALEKAYEKVGKISFKNAYYRKDIGQKALKAEG